MFRIVRRAAVGRTEARTDTKKSLAHEFTRLRTQGASDAEALRILFDMVTTNGPVPEIGGPEDRRAG